MIDFRKAVLDDIGLIRELAEISWHHGYKGVISDQQISFMLEDLYSNQALEQAMEAGQLFYIVSLEHIPMGFIAVKLETKKLRIEKLYLVPTAQGQGLGKALIDHGAAIALAHNLPTLELNVNRKNRAYYFYLKQGFTVFKEVDIPYHGFILDDYVMQKAIR